MAHHLEEREQESPPVVGTDVGDSTGTQRV
jgi:hypothetical protein